MEVMPNGYPAGLLNFIYELPHGYNSFPEHVLKLIDKHLGYHMLTFIPLNSSFLSLRNADPKTWINEYRTLGISRELLEKYNLYGHKLDVFRFRNLPQHLWDKPFLAAEEAFAPGEFLRSEYGQYLSELNIPHQVVLNLVYKNVRLGVISIYHTPQDGPFTEKDAALLEWVSRFVAQHYMLAISRSQRNMAADLFKSCYKKLGLGVIMVDHDFHVVDANPAAENYAADICQAIPQKVRIPVRGLPSSQQANAQAIIRAYSSQLFFSSDPFTVSTGQYSYEFQINSFPSSTSNLSRVEMVYLIFLVQSTARRLPKYSEEARPKLTEREWQVADLIAAGLTNAQIAEQTSTSIHTVKTHILNIYKKLDVKNRASLIRALDSMRED